MITTTPTTSKENFIKNNEKIQEIWDNASDFGTSPYLDKKQVGAHGLRFHDGKILVPLRDFSGVLFGIQDIKTIRAASSYALLSLSHFHTTLGL